MKNTRPTEVKPGAKDALTEQAHYTLLRITVKALPWLALHAAAIIVVSLNAGGAL